MSIKESGTTDFSLPQSSVTHDIHKAKESQKNPKNTPKISASYEPNIIKRIPFVSLISVILISLIFGFWASGTDSFLEPAIAVITAFSILFTATETKLLYNVSKAYKEKFTDVIKQYETKMEERLSEREKKITESENRCREILQKNDLILKRNESVLKENQEILLRNSEILKENNVIKAENERLVNVRNENEIAQIRREYEQIIEQYNITIRELTES